VCSTLVEPTILEAEKTAAELDAQPKPGRWEWEFDARSLPD
jgi:hypothetical protein